MTVIVDTFEVTNNGKTEEQLKKGGVDYTVQSLTKGGDYIIEGSVEKIVIERKEINDLFSSNHSGRLDKQMEKLRVEYPDYKKILLIEGNISSVVNRSMGRSAFKKTEDKNVVEFSMKSKFSIMAKYSAEFVGIVSSIITTSDINIIQVASKWQSIILLKNLDEWSNGKRSKGRKASADVKKVGRDDNREVIDLLLSIKGVGWKTAKEMLAKHNSIVSIVNFVQEKTEEEVKKEFGASLGAHLIELFKKEVKEVV